MSRGTRPTTLQDLRASGWVSKTVKQEIRDNFLRMLQAGEDLFPGIIGYDNTVLPEINLALHRRPRHALSRREGPGQEPPDALAGPLPRRRDPLPRSSLAVRSTKTRITPSPRPASVCWPSYPKSRLPIAWWPRQQRYAERLAPGTKFADVIGEIDPAKLAAGTSMSAEEALHFGLIPRMHRGIFAMNEMPELDELVQVGLFNILEERDVQIRGYPIQFDLDVLILFSANPATYNRSGKVIPQLKDRIGSLIQTHYPLDRSVGIEIMEQEAGHRPRRRLPGAGAVLHEGDHRADQHLRPQVEVRRSPVRRQRPLLASPTIGRWWPAPATAACAWARSRPCRASATWAICYSSSLGKLELDMMGSQQMSERQVLEAIMAEAITTVFEEYVEKTAWRRSRSVFGKGVKIEVGDMLPSSHYAERLKRVPKAWEKAFEVNPSESEAVRASCVEFVLAGLYAGDRISRSQKHGRITYEIR